MSKENNIFQWVEFIAKYLVVGISAIWVLCVGTDYIQKQTAELEYRNLKLGKNSVPIAKQSLSFHADNAPWGTNRELCNVSGQYSVINKGVLPFQIDKVLFSVYEVPVLKYDKALGNKVTSLTLSNLLNKLDPIYTEEILEPARVGTGGTYSRSFMYTIHRSKGMLYSVVANASGAVIGVEEENNELLTFGPNELKITSGLSSICGGDATLRQHNESVRPTANASTD